MPKIGFGLGEIGQIMLEDGKIGVHMKALI